MKCSTFDNIATEKIKKYIVENINAHVWSFYGLLGSVQFSLFSLDTLYFD